MTEGSSPKPTPVRDALPGGRPQGEVRFASARFETDDGEVWLVEELGWTLSGQREDAGAPLLLLGFRREGSEDLDREALVPVRRLGDIPDHQLPVLLSSSRRFEGPTPERPFFAGAQSRAREARGRSRGRRRRR